MTKALQACHCGHSRRECVSAWHSALSVSKCLSIVLKEKARKEFWPLKPWDSLTHSLALLWALAMIYLEDITPSESWEQLILPTGRAPGVSAFTLCSHPVLWSRAMYPQTYPHTFLPPQEYATWTLSAITVCPCGRAKSSLLHAFSVKKSMKNSNIHSLEQHPQGSGHGTKPGVSGWSF